MLIRVNETDSNEPRVPISSIDDRIAMEKGRLMAARVIAEDEGKRKELEARYGSDVIRQRYPEAYRSGFFRMLDRIAAMW